jgi:hypothetical protein
MEFSSFFIKVGVFCIFLGLIIGAFFEPALGIAGMGLLFFVLGYISLLLCI